MLADDSIIEADNLYIFEGNVDFYGFHTGAGGWFVGGWVAHPWPLGHRPGAAVAEFPEQTISGHTHSAFYHREDVSGQGIGFVFFLRSPAAPKAGLTALRVTSGGTQHRIFPTPQTKRMPEAQLVGHLSDLLGGGEEGSQRQEMQALLFGASDREAAAGFIDVYGYHGVSGGWLLWGWISRGWPEAARLQHVVLCFEEGDIGGEAYGVLYPRPDLKDGAEGVAFFVRGEAAPLGRLCSVSFEATGLKATMYTAPTSARLREIELTSRLRPLLGQALPGLSRELMLALLARQPFRGEDTLTGLSTPVFIEVDEAILAGEDGLVLMGWCLARPGAIRDIRVRSGTLSTPLNLAAAIRLDRPDVLEGFAQHGFDDPRCGFIAFLPATALEPGGKLYFEVETGLREIGYRTIPSPRLEGIAAIKRLLSVVDIRFGQVQRAYDQVLGPAVEGLNKARLAKRPEVSVVQYGKPPARPRFSVIVPLYGRLDFVEYQLALFSAHPRCAGIEFIYVLDDPPRAREAQFLFASVYERFLIPFKALLLDRNVGFAPANNIGLAEARGTYIAYLNSDVFPGTLDWLERLAAQLEADPSIGVIGPALLFEDGSVQHRGMHFQPLDEFGGWFFGLHHDKGKRLSGKPGLEEHIAITGACMLLPRALAREVGGLDEIYVIGDFEDTDLCLKLQQRGYRCVVDPSVQLFHLERKSQASSGLGWRMNLTVYNAWQHQRRWGALIAARQKP